MEGLEHCVQLQGEVSPYWMNSLCLSLKFRAAINLTTATRSSRNSSLRYFCVANGRGGVVTREAAVQLKENWLSSLSCPFPNTSSAAAGIDNLDSPWVIGVDPDVSGAIAVLRPTQNDNDNAQSSVLRVMDTHLDSSGVVNLRSRSRTQVLPNTSKYSQVFDSPHVKVLIGKRTRRRLDAKSIVHLLRSFNAPIGTTAYLEQSTPFPQDGKQGWWSGGFGYGLWIGVLVASGFSVVPVPSVVWKNEFRLCGSRSSKDDSRQLASTLYPSMSPLLKRKKDHGRAEALLIAAYGKGLKLNTNLSDISEELTDHMD